MSAPRKWTDAELRAAAVIVRALRPLDNEARLNALVIAAKAVVEPELSARVWRILESQPGFNARLRAAEAELEAGGGERYEVRDGELHRSTGATEE